MAMPATERARDHSSGASVVPVATSWSEYSCISPLISREVIALTAYPAVKKLKKKRGIRKIAVALIAMMAVVKGKFVRFCKVR